MTTPSASPSPRPHQVEALTDLVRAFAVHDRGQLRMACAVDCPTATGSRYPAASTLTLDKGTMIAVAIHLQEWRACASA